MWDEWKRYAAPAREKSTATSGVSRSPSTIVAASTGTIADVPAESKAEEAAENPQAPAGQEEAPAGQEEAAAGQPEEAPAGQEEAPAALEEAQTAVEYVDAVKVILFFIHLINY